MSLVACMTKKWRADRVSLAHLAARRIRTRRTSMPPTCIPAGRRDQEVDIWAAEVVTGELEEEEDDEEDSETPKVAIEAVDIDPPCEKKRRERK